MGLAVEQWAALPADDPRRPLFARALRVLAAREHGREELRAKLAAPAVSTRRAYGVDDTPAERPDEEMLEDVLEALEREGYLSDQRFAESFVNQRVQRGHGPRRIKQDLQQKQIASDWVTLAFETCEADWFELARDVRERKYGEEIPKEFKEKARQMRFLQSRGFEMSQIQYALEPQG